MSDKFNFYLSIRDSFDARTIPVLWVSAKTYYEENSLKSHSWNWSDPWLAYDYSVDEIIKQCYINPPNIFGFSIYVWNENFMDELASKIKKEFPNCIIVYGGPQIDIKYSNDFFKIKSWVDVVCPSDGYGEIIIKELLDQYPNIDYESIPYIFYTNSNREKIQSKKALEKKSFEWPKNIYESQEQHLLTKIDEVHYTMLETTRGCPYKCIYCDWGGGTYTKIVSKPYTTILDEIDWIAKNKIPILEMSSANFGILPIDVDISEYVVETTKKYNYPRIVQAENAKNNLDRVFKIKSLWAKAGLLNHYKISIQTVDEEIKKNVERLDPPLEQQISVARQLQSYSSNLPIKTETIIGLPGDSYQIQLKQIDLLFEHSLPMTRSSIWMLLPEAPAYSPEMREKFKIKTIRKMFATNTWSIKKGFPLDPGVSSNSFPYNPNTESVVGTYSYSTEEFVDMFIINSFAQAGDSTGINKYLINYIVSTYKVNPSEIFNYIFENYIKNTSNWKNKELKNEFSKIFNTFNGWVNGNVVDTGLDYDDQFPLILSSHTYTAFVIFMNLESFYKEICQALADLYNDIKIIDLGHYITNSLIDLSYNPDVGRTFETKYNWLKYFDSGMLESGNFKFAISDKDVYANASYQPIDWHNISTDPMQIKKQFVYKQLGDITVPKISKTIKCI